MTHTHIYTQHIRTLPDGRDIIACACGHQFTAMLAAASSPELASVPAERLPSGVPVAERPVIPETGTPGVSPP